MWRRSSLTGSFPNRARAAIGAGLRLLRLLVLAGILAPSLAVGARAQATVAMAEESGARTVLSPYLPSRFTGPRYSLSHKMAQVPLNWLGLDLVQIDMTADLPDPAAPEVRGILLWLPSDNYSWDPGDRHGETLERLYRWLHRALDHGKRVAVLGSLPTYSGDGAALALERMEALLARIGLEEEGDWSIATYGSRFAVSDPEMMEFERPYGRVLPPMSLYKPVRSDVTSHLVVDRRSDPRQRSHLVVTSPRGGFVAEGYSHYTGPGTDLRQWYINPFAFFARAFATSLLPKPDFTTLAGRRLYYSHIDGDGWRSISTVERYEKKMLMSADVVRMEAIEPYPDLPVAVAPIGADLDSNWSGNEESRSIARALFALPQVEVASHTYTHPFAWEFYENYDREIERPFLPLWAQQHGYDIAAQKSASPGPGTADQAALARVSALIGDNYDLPRAYGRRAFKLEQEIAGSLRYFRSLAPAGKPARLVQWSGNTSPFPAALAASYRNNGLNINGGDSRFDREYPSYAYVAPVGLRLGEHIQVYATNSNENTYTDLWQSRYFGYGDLPETWDNTETPRRVQATNLYYHMYSGEIEAALNALIANIENIRTREITPVDASHYVEIALGFFSTRFEPAGERRWRVLDRGRLQTVRFADGDRLEVDFAASEGVLGQRRHLGQLYVALDEAVADPLIALRVRSGDRPPAVRPWLEFSRWHVWNFARTPSGFSVRGRGFGPGEMRWRVPADGGWRVRLRAEGGNAVIEAEARNGVLDLSLPVRTGETVDLAFERSGT